MRLTWFTSLRAGRRRKGKRQQLKAVPLRVRQLERRRVLDGAVASVVVSTVVVADAGQPAPAATTTNATDAPPIVAPVESTVGISSSDTAHAASLSPAQGLAGNTPPVLVAATNQQINEGQLLNLSASGGTPPLALYIDPDLADTHTATVDWGDGSPVQNATITAGVGAGAIGGTHTYAEDGNYTVTVNVADNNGGAASQSFSVLVKNVPPVLVTATDQTINEGSQLDLSGAGGAPPIGLFVDPGILDTHTGTIDWGDGGPIQNATVIEASGAGVLGGTHTYADNGVYTVTVTVSDDDGGTSSGTFKVTVNNVAPFVDLTGPTVVNEGSSNDWNLGPVVDPGTDTVTQYIIHWGDGNTDTYTAAQIAGMSNTISHTYADGPNNYTIAVDLVDEDGTFTSVDTLGVTVNNVTPFVELSGPSNINEGSPGSWNVGPVVDPGTDTVTQYIIHWGDGNTDTFTAGQIAGMSGVIGHTYADGPNSYTIAVDLVDEDGTHLAVDTLAVAVNNVPPVVDISGPTAVNEGTPNTWLLGAIVDPGTDAVSQYVIHWGDGNSDTFTAGQIAGMGNMVGHTYVEGPNSYTISVDLVDEDGTYLSVDTLQVTVDNVAPSVALNAVPDISENGVATLTGSYTDSGVEDAHTVTVNWADTNNGSPSTFTVAAIQDSTGTPTLSVGDTFTSSTDGAILTVTSINAVTGQVGFSVQHQYLDDGFALGNNTNSDASIIGVTVTDDDADSGNSSTTVTVHNVTPSVSLNLVADINENGIAIVTGSYTDIGLLDAHVVTVNWDDANNTLASTFAVSAIQNAAGTATLNVGDTFNSSTDSAVLTITAIDATTGQVSFSVQHQYLDDGLAPGNNTASDASTIGVAVADDDAESGSSSAVVTVHNVAPSVALNSVIDISENGVATVSGSYTDTGLLDAHTLTVNWDDPNSALASTFAVNAIRNAAGTQTLNIGDTFNSSTDSAVLTITSIDAATGQVGFSVQHQYLDDGLALGNNTTSDTSTIGVTVADDDLQSGSNTTKVTVHNVTPSVSLNSVPNINENGVATLTGSYTDIGRLDAHTLTVTWGDPNNGLASTFAVSAIQNAAGTATLNVGDTFSSSTDSAVLTITSINAVTGQVGFSVQHQYLDDGLALGNNTISDVSTIGVTVADDDAQSGSNTTSVTVNNVAPGVTLNSVADINENGVATLTGSYTDIGLLDAHKVTINWDDPNNGSASTFAVNAIRNAAGTTTLSVGDTFNSSTDSAVLTITAIDATTGQVSFSVQHQYLDDGLALGNNTISDVSNIGITVADDDAQNSSTTTTVTVHNVTPAVALNVVSDINENGIATLTGAYTDIGLLDAHTVTIDWGDPNNGLDSTFAVNAIRNAAGAATLSVGDTFASSTDSAVLTITSIDATTGQVGYSVQHQYLDDGLALGNNTASDVSTIGVTVADDDAQSGSDTVTVTVHNVTPAVTLNAVPDINENGVATLTGSYTDIGLLDAHAVTVDWDDPNNGLDSTFAVNAIRNAAGAATLNVGDTFSSSTDGAILTITAIDTTTGQVSFSVQHQYLDDGLALGNNTISDVSMIGVTVADDDTQSGNQTATITVHNVTPAVALNAVPDINENGVATLTGSYTDIGLLDAHVLTVNWADGNNASASTFAVNAIRNAAGTATLSVGDTFNSSTDSAILTITSINAATGQVGFSVQHQYLDDGPAPGNGTTSDVSIIGVTVADDDAQSGSNTTTVTVHNVAPTLINVTGDSIDEGHVATTGLIVVDPGTLDVFTVNVDWRDGSTATIGGLGLTDVSGTVGSTNYTWTAATRQLTLTHLYADNANYPVVVRMADDDMAANFAGAPSDANYVQQTTLVTVANLAPTLAGTSNLAVDEGSGVTLVGLGVHIEDLGFDNPANQTPPPLGSLTTEEFSAFSIDWGDGFTTTPVNVVDRVSGAPINSTSASLTTAQFLHASHFYADDGTYTVTVRIADDNMGAFSNPALFTTGVAGVDYVDRQFQIVVKNVTPTLGVISATSQQQTGSGSVTTTPVTPATTITINESGTVSFNAGFTDPGFSLDPNPSNPAGTNFPRNELFRYYINWGDNRETVGELTAADVASLTNGGPAVLTSGAFDTTGMIHTYADDGTYTVTIRLADDNMGAFADTSLFATGVGVGMGTDNGGDFVETTFTVVVNNIAPSFVPQPGGENVAGTDVNSQGQTTINVGFSDPGFDNTVNPNGPAPPTITDTLHESFTHVIDWGDGTVDAVHTYADSSTHDVTITQTGPGGTQTFTVPGIGGLNQVLTLVSSQDINNPAAVLQPFTYVVDWGDGNVQTISLMLKAPGGPTVNGLTTVNTLVRTPGNVGVQTTGSFTLTHQYLGPPDPLNPAADIQITVAVVDDNNASISDFVAITNPGAQIINVAIDTTPDVPRLELLPQAAPQVILSQQSAAPSSLQPNVPRIARSELTTTSDRFLELVVVSPDGNEIERYRLSDEALVDLRGLFSTLPDNRYKIYLIRTDNNSRRLVMDVFVRRGRVIDPSDDSEGTRDRPPTAEGTQQKNVQQNNGQQNNAKPNGAPQKQVVPLQNNPLLKKVPNENSGAANEPGLPAIGPEVGAQPEVKELSDSRPTGLRGSMRWALPLAGLGLVASRESWSERLGAALETADERSWQRLRQAGRLGKSGGKSPVPPEKQSATTNSPS